MPKRYDLTVVGAGPAGMAAADRAVRGGLRVALVDAGAGLGGQYWRQPAPLSDASARSSVSFSASAKTGPYAGSGHQVTEDETASLHHRLSTFRRLRSRLLEAADHGTLDLFVRHQVWTAGRADESAQAKTAPAEGAQHFVLRAVDQSRTPDVERVITAAAVVLTTGAYDRSLPFPGWDLPGVLTVGGLQALLKADSVVAGGRVAIGGTGPFLLPVASGLASRGVHVVGIFESGPATSWLRYSTALPGNGARLVEGAGYAATFARRRIPYRTRSMIVAAHGKDRVEAVTVARLTGEGHLQPGSQRRIEVDAVGVGWGFTPQLDLQLALGCELAEGPDGSVATLVDQDQRASAPGVYVAGEATGIGGAALALCEGAAAGEAVCADLGRSTGSARRAIRRLHSRRARLQRFAAAMQRAHPVPAGWLEALADDTTICRCEEIPYGSVREVLRRHGAADARQLKQLSRVGMGWCQGRVCGFAADLVTARLTGETPVLRPPPRPVATPITLGMLASASAEPTAKISESGEASDD